MLDSFKKEPIFLLSITTDFFFLSFLINGSLLLLWRSGERLAGLNIAEYYGPRRSEGG